MIYAGMVVTFFVVMLIVNIKTPAFGAHSRYNSNWYWVLRLTGLAMPVLAMIALAVLATWRRSRNLGINWKMVNYKHPLEHHDALEETELEGQSSRAILIGTENNGSTPNKHTGMWDGS